jgi:hypothetical protein
MLLLSLHQDRCRASQFCWSEEASSTTPQRFAFVLPRDKHVAAFPGLSIREWNDILKSPRRKKGHFYCAYQTNEKAPFKQANKLDAASEMHHVIRTSIMGSMPYFHSLSNAMAQAVGFNVNDVRERESIDQQ